MKNKLINFLGALFIAPNLVCAQASDQSQEDLYIPDGWFAASSDPCDYFISLQKTNRANINFTYAYFLETETNTIDSISRLLIKNLNCLNPQIQKNEIGSQVIKCDSNLNIEIWEETKEELSLNIIATLITANLIGDDLNIELPKLVQVSNKYQSKSLEYYRTNRCNQATFDPHTNRKK